MRQFWREPFRPFYESVNVKISLKKNFYSFIFCGLFLGIIFVDFPISIQPEQYSLYVLYCRSIFDVRRVSRSPIDLIVCNFINKYTSIYISTFSFSSLHCTLCAIYNKINVAHVSYAATSYWFKRLRVFARISF